MATFEHFKHKRFVTREKDVCEFRVFSRPKIRTRRRSLVNLRDDVLSIRLQIGDQTAFLEFEGTEIDAIISEISKLKRGELT